MNRLTGSGSKRDHVAANANGTDNHAADRHVAKIAKGLADISHWPTSSVLFAQHKATHPIAETLSTDQVLI